jgi:hypothetical protein
MVKLAANFSIRGVLREIESSYFFLKKSNQKNFTPLRAGVAPSGSQQKNQSFFASFCSQKEVLSSFAFSGTT